MPDAPKNWRDIRPGPPPAVPAGKGRDWQQRAPASSEPKRTRHLKLFVAGVSLFFLMVLIGVVVIWLRPLQPACIVLVGSGYEENLFLTHNAPGWKGLLNLEKHVAEQDTYLSMRFPWDQPSKIRRVGPPIELEAGKTWNDVWKNIPAFKEKTLILFLSLHGVADQSDAYLLANDGRAQTRISFGDILDGLKNLSNKKVVVFLDVGQVKSHWPTGMLHNDFVKRLREKYDDKIQAMSNVLVVCAVGPDQKGWSTPVWQNSVFSHYVAEGLKGAAAKGANERITARRLFDYVESKVEQWAQLNRARNQKPIMLGKPGLAETVELVYINAPYKEPAALDAGSFEPGVLEEDWKKWKELNDSAPYIHSPHLWRLYQETLLRYEQLMRAGDPTGKAQAVKDRLKKIEEKLDLAKEQNWLKKMEVEFGPREPVEVHLGKMLRDADPRLSDAAKKLALGTRIQAEEAALAAKNGPQSYPYSEVIFAWTKEQIKKADLVRRQGEDLLFGNPDKHETPASEKLAEAQGQYLKIRQEAEIFQRALTVRDEVAADLPQLASWLALAPPGGDLLDKTRDLRDAWPSLGKNLSKLNEALDSVTSAPSADKIALLTDQVDSAHKDLRKRYSDIAGKYSDVTFQRNWHEIDHALSIPPVDGDIDLRLDLLRKLHKITGELHAGTQKGPVEEAATDDERQKLILKGLLQPYGARETTSDEKLRDFFLDLPGRINLPDTINKEPEDPVEVMVSLLGPANLCRIVPGGLVDESNSFAAVDRLRRLRTFGLLKWQAERTWQDHWFEPGKPDYTADDAQYYLPVAKNYIECARELVKADRSKDVFLREIEEFAREKLKLSRLASLAKETRYWTSEPSIELIWNVRVEGTLPPGSSDGELPPGTPMGWLRLEGQEKERKKLDWSRDFRSLKLLDHLDRSVKTRQATLRGLFRGQQFDCEVTLERPDPDVIVRQNPPPKMSGLAVRLSEFNFGAVSIVLDNSGSMTREPNSEKEAEKGKRRWDYAVKALEKVLGALPENTPISLCTFGPVDKKVDVTKTGIRRIQRPKVLTRDERKQLISDLEQAEAQDIDFNSPVAAGIIDSMENGFPAEYLGAKVILVLTDGEDNYSFPEFRKRDLENGVLVYVAIDTSQVQKELLKAHNQPKNQNINVVVIGLIDETQEEAKQRAKTTRAQFEVVEEFTPKSVFRFSKDPEGLGKTILDILQPRLELFENGKRVPSFNLGYAGNRLDSGAIDWAKDLPPRTYQVRFSKNEFDVRLDPAQNLFMVLKRENRRYYLERGVLGEQPEAKNALSQKRGKKSDEWLVSLLGHHFDGDRLSGDQLEQLIAFENLETKSSTVKQRYPGFVWLELSAGEESLKDTLTWENDPNVAAPAFRLKTSSWPNIKAQPRLSAWFSTADRRGFLGAKFDFVYRMNMGKTIPNLPANGAVIESAKWENRGEENVFVVRVQHAPQKPVFIDLDDFEKPRPPGVSVEHYFYRKAGRYTVIFHGLPERQDLDVVMIDLVGFKKQAEQVVFPRGDDAILAPIMEPKNLLGPGR